MTQSFVVRDLFPTDAFHLIYGPSGAGRSTLLLQILWQWSQGQDVLGHPSLPAPFALITTLQTRTALRARLSKLGMDSTKIPHLSLLEAGLREDRTIEGAYRVAKNIAPSLKVLFLDGMASLCPGNIGIFREAAMFLADIAHLCYKQQITIIGTTSCGKSDDEGFKQRPIGSIAWSEYASTSIQIEITNTQKEHDPDRTLHIIPRIEPPWSERYTIDPKTHLFVAIENESDAHANLNAWIAQQATGEPISTHAMLEAGKLMGLSERTVWRWLGQVLELGLVQKDKRGVYSRPVQN